MEQQHQHMRPDPESFVAWNEEMAHKYDLDNWYTRSSFLIRFVEQRRVRHILDSIDPKSGNWVLDIGCGTGFILQRLKQGKLVGVDISELMMQRARRRSYSTSVALARSDVAHLPFRDGTFDRACCSEVLEHVLDPDKAIQEIGRVLKKGGLFILSVPNEPLINRLKRFLVKLGLFSLLETKYYKSPRNMATEWHLSDFSLTQYKAMLNHHLRVVKVETVPFPKVPVKYVIKCVKA